MLDEFNFIIHSRSVQHTPEGKPEHIQCRQRVPNDGVYYRLRNIACCVHKHQALFLYRPISSQSCLLLDIARSTELQKRARGHQNENVTENLKIFSLIYHLLKLKLIYCTKIGFLFS